MSHTQLHIFLLLSSGEPELRLALWGGRRVGQIQSLPDALTAHLCPPEELQVRDVSCRFSTGGGPVAELGRIRTADGGREIGGPGHFAGLLVAFRRTDTFLPLHLARERDA